MNTALIGSETINLLSQITGQKLSEQELKPPLIFLAALVTVLLGVIHADGKATDTEVRRLLTTLNQFVPPDSDVRRLAHLMIKGVRENKLYTKSNELQTLTAPLSEPESLLLISFGYEMSAVDGEIDACEKKYLQIIGSCLGIDSRYLSVLEASFNSQGIVEPKALDEVYSLLEPNQFQSLDALFVNAAKSIVENLPAKEKPQTAQAFESCSLELQQSATKLKELIKPCFDELHHAEDVYNSKTRISELSKEEICEQIGELSGRDFRIISLGKKYKLQATKQVNKSWEERIKQLRQKWFIDANKQPKQGIGWGDKDGFIKDIRSTVGSQSIEIILMIKENLSIVYQEVEAINIELIEHYLKLLDQQTKTELSHQINLNFSEIKTKFCNPTEHPPSNGKNFMVAVSSPLGALVNKGWGDIYWEEVVKFKNEVTSIIDDIVNVIFDDRVKLASEAVAKTISFYDDFLERQERYQQETPEQRQAEKAWISQKRQELEQVQKNIEAILPS
jgi:uncharacterized tellurite resistance protein B-like protein